MTTTFKKLREKVLKDLWGFNTSRQVKPVQFANGFFRAICGQTGLPNLIVKTAGGYQRGSNGTTTEQLLTDIREYYDIENENDVIQRMNDIRLALDLALGQDGALFQTERMYSLTLTHYLLTSSDPSESGTGKFMTEVLALSQDSEIINCLRSSLSKKNDNIFLLAGPLLNDKSLGPIPEASETVEKIVNRSACLQRIQRSFSTIVKYESKLEKTVFLQRVVLLGYFSIYLHLTNTSIENKLGMVPLFLAGSDPSPEIREASRSTFARARQQIERSFGEGFIAELVNRGEDRLSKSQYIELMKSWLPEFSEDDSIWISFIQDFEGNLLGTDNVTEAFQRSCVRAAFSIKENPETFSAFIGKNLGLVYPRDAGRGEKYYLPSSQFLDMLVVSLLEPGEEVTMDEFWERAWNNFGILCGINSTGDSARLAKWGIRQTSPRHLANNARKIIAELTRMGYVREYADDIAVIRGGGIQGE